MADNEPQNPSEEEPKIIIDDDWKAQAQAEKEKLAEQVATGGQAGGQAGEAGAAPADAGPRELPPADFATLVSSLATQVMMALGGMVDPRTNRRVLDLALAKHHIDTLTMLEGKTKGNLTDDEKKLLDQALFEIRMHYVQIAQQAG